MVYDDDTSRTRNIDPDQEPLDMHAPRDERTRDLIIETARAHPNWHRIRIYEELRACVRGLDEAEVNHVLNEYKLPNLYL